jgi:hypothetical protein
MTNQEQAHCRWCRKPLRGKPYYQGGGAWDIETGEKARVNHYGGYVCSRGCDFRAGLELEQSMPGHGYSQRTLGCFAQKSLERNWEDA